MKMKIGKSSENHKISAMVLKVAEAYIDMGETREERENYLRSACSAWNIACLPPLKRESSISQYIEQYREINQADPAECKALEEDLRLLIKLFFNSCEGLRRSKPPSILHLCSEKA